MIVGVAVLVLGVIISFAGSWLMRPHQAQHAIAVLPLKNLSPEPDADYFGDGLTDQIIHDLSIINGLEVKSRASSFAFKDKRVNIRDAGRQLEADLVLDGSVLHGSGRVRLNIALVRVADDVTLCSQRYDREMNDIFAI